MTHTTCQKKGARRNQPGAPVCGAKLRNKDRTCRSPIIFWRTGRCWLHNGKARRGRASSRWKHGQFADKGLWMGDRSFGEVCLDDLKARMTRLVLNQAVIAACDRLGVPELALFVTSAISKELSLLEAIVKALPPDFLPEGIMAHRLKAVRRSEQSARASLRSVTDGMVEKFLEVKPGRKRTSSSRPAQSESGKRGRPGTPEEPEADLDFFFAGLSSWMKEEDGRNEQQQRETQN